ncbi:transketolase C-terminal domain-containing protein [Arthrobacter sp. NPDC056493]|uniref:transketolase C-terminal domain-containing protein n=1 Tax=Arthrobacter sp. NPDC056493 TaxID=3345839 RepID=UPI003670A176
MDAETLLTAAGETRGRVIIAEDHHPEGGLGSAVKDALLLAPPSDLSISHLAVHGMPGSGTGPELLAWAGIDAKHIAQAARHLIQAGTPAGRSDLALPGQKP